jgi:hypothetical protein
VDFNIKNTEKNLDKTESIQHVHVAAQIHRIVCKEKIIQINE